MTNMAFVVGHQDTPNEITDMQASKANSTPVHITPANLGITPPAIPTVAIVQAYVTAQAGALNSTPLYYTGTTTATDAMTYLFDVDNAGRVFAKFAPDSATGGLAKLGTITANPNPALEGIYTLDATTAAFDFTLPAATDSQKRTILVTSSVATNAVTVKVQTGEFLNGVVNGTSILNVNGKQFQAIDRATGGWDITPFGGAGVSTTPLGVGYLRLNNNIVSGAANTELGLGNWAAEAGFANNINQASGGGAGFRLLAGRTYEIEAHLYVNGLGNDEMLFAEFRDRANITVSLPATIMGGGHYANGTARESMSGVVKALVRPTVDFDCVIAIQTWQTTLEVTTEAPNRSTSIICKELPSTTPVAGTDTNLGNTNLTLTGARTLTQAGNTLTVVGTGIANVIFNPNGIMSGVGFDVSCEQFTPTGTTAPAINYTNARGIKVNITAAMTGNITLPAPTFPTPIASAFENEYTLVFENTSASARTISFNGNFLATAGAALAAMSIPVAGRRTLKFVANSATQLRLVYDGAAPAITGVNAAGTNTVQNIRFSAAAQSFANAASPSLTPATIVNKHTFTIPASAPLWLPAQAGTIAMQTSSVAGDNVTIDIINLDTTNARIITFAAGYHNGITSGFTVTIPAGGRKCFVFSVTAVGAMTLTTPMAFGGTDGQAIVRVNGVWQPATLPAGGSNNTRSFVASEALALGDILELQPAGTVRKAAQVVAVAFNNNSASPRATTRNASWWNSANGNEFITVFVGNNGSEVSTRKKVWNGTDWVDSTPLSDYNQGNFSAAWTVMGCSGVNSVYSARVLLGAARTEGGFTFWSVPADGSNASGNFIVDSASSLGNGIIHPPCAFGRASYLLLNSGTSSNVRFGALEYSGGTPSQAITNIVTSLDVDANFGIQLAHVPAGVFPISARQWNFMLLKRNSSANCRWVATCHDTIGNFTVFLESPNFAPNTTTAISTPAVLGVNNNIVYLGYIDGANLSVRRAVINTDSTLTYDASDIATIPHGMTVNAAIKVTAHRGLAAGQFIITGENGTGNQIVARTGTINLTNGTLALNAAIPYTLGAGLANGNSRMGCNVAVRNDNTNGAGVAVFANGTVSTTVGFVDSTVGTVNQNPVGLASAAIANGASGLVALDGAIITGLSGLTVGSMYYMNTTTGAFQLGVTTVKVGIALSATELQVRL